MTCLNCGSPKVKAKGRCTACYEFQRRNHRDRTSAEVAAANLRKWEREHPGAWRIRPPGPDDMMFPRGRVTIVAIP